ncbi:MAG: host-nuclease inhibitor Gam family protein [Lachnospiraceae bacterium]|nr:host-nuclease inhibitor Gam family protein [Lachnospiraceae bacterium]MBP5462448.1 host-nuclease inhibitor Gam family protein [Lachnospiraceae bacterium]
MSEADERFRVVDDQTAEWCIEQIKNANKEKKKWKAFYDERYRRVCEACDRTIANMESMLQTYFENVPHKVTKTQESYALPSGKLVFKAQGPEFERDDAAIMKWMYENSNTPSKYIKTKESLDWDKFRKTLSVIGETVCDENGEIIPGIKATERPSVFKVEIRKENNDEEVPFECDGN